MTEEGEFVEVQGTAETQPFKLQDLNEMLELAQEAIKTLIWKQKEALGL